jgi:hypothetical protein
MLIGLRNKIRYYLVFSLTINHFEIRTNFPLIVKLRVKVITLNLLYFVGVNFKFAHILFAQGIILHAKIF